MSNRPAKNADPWVSVILIAQLSIIAGQEARTQGATWDDLLHWAGELLLISGIVLAAWGISDVRREWTQLPGFWGSIEWKTRAMRAHAATTVWRTWNRFARPLHLRLYSKSANPRPLTIPGTTTMRRSSLLNSGWAVRPPGMDFGERLTWLENHMEDVRQDIRTFDMWHHQEVRDRQAATEKEQAAREAEDQRIRELMADLAGGGLRLQAWGVACLLAGTIIPPSGE